MKSANRCRRQETTKNYRHPKGNPNLMGALCFMPSVVHCIFFYFSMKSRRHPCEESILPVVHSADISQTSATVPDDFPLSADTADTVFPSPEDLFLRSADKCRRHLGVIVSVRRHPQTLADIRRHGQSTILWREPFYSHASVSTFAARRQRRASRRSQAQRRHQRNSLVRFSRLEKCHARILSHFPARYKSSTRYIWFQVK